MIALYAASPDVEDKKLAAPMGVFAVAVMNTIISPPTVVASSAIPVPWLDKDSSNGLLIIIVIND
jgi:hypothetical protein